MLLGVLFVLFVNKVNCDSFNETEKKINLECGGIFNQQQFIIESPNYPGNYPLNVDCNYVLTGQSCPTEYQLQLLDFSLESSLGCTKDRLEIEDKDALCGNTGGSKSYLANKGVLQLRFISNSNISGRGFRILVTRLPCQNRNLTPIPYVPPTFINRTGNNERHCCAASYSGKRFFLSSPGFPYSNNKRTDCTYTIFKSNGNVCRLRIHFLFFWSGEFDRFGCSKGFLEIDGKKICGCRTGLKLIAPFKLENFKTLIFLNQGYPQTAFSGFAVEVIQDECPKRLNITTNTTQSDFHYYNDQNHKIAWPQVTQISSAVTLSANTEILDDVLTNNKQKIAKHVYVFAEPEDGNFSEGLYYYPGATQPRPLYPGRYIPPQAYPVPNFPPLQFPFARPQPPCPDNRPTYPAQPGVLKPGEYFPNQNNPGQINPGRYNPSEFDPRRSNPGQFDPNELNPEQFNPGHLNPGQLNPGQLNPGQLNPGQSNPGQSNPRELNPGKYPGQSYPGQSYPYPGQSSPGQYYPGQSFPGQSYPEQFNPNQHIPRQNNPHNPNQFNPSQYNPNPGQYYPEYYPKGRDIEETNYYDTSDLKEFLPDGYDNYKCRAWGIVQWTLLAKEILWQQMPQCESNNQGTVSKKCLELPYLKGYFQTAGYPYYYPRNSNSCYRIIKQEGYCYVRLFMKDFQLENSYECKKDYFLSGSGHRYCGNSLQNTEAWLDLRGKTYEEMRFVSDQQYCGRGFKAVYEQIACTDTGYPFNPTPVPPTTTTTPTTNCDRTIRERVFTLQVENYDRDSCKFSIIKWQPDICTLELDLLAFDLPCNIGHMLIQSRKYCGNLSGQKLYVNFDVPTMPIVFYRNSNEIMSRKIQIEAKQTQNRCEVPAERVSSPNRTLIDLRPKLNETTTTKKIPLNNVTSNGKVNLGNEFQDICGVLLNTTRNNLTESICNILLDGRRNVECIPIKDNVIYVPYKEENIELHLNETMELVQDVVIREISCDDDLLGSL